MTPYPLHINFAFRKHMIINREFEALLKRNGLDAFDAIMKFDQGEVVKQKNKYRSTIRLHIVGDEGHELFYLKRYRIRLIPEFLKNCLFFSRTYSAIHEWRNILEFKACNLPTMTPVAVGMKRRIPFWNESFLLTRAILNTKTLEKELEDHFDPPLDQDRLKQKRVLLDKLAALTQSMHGEGFKHQDFYLCHILVNDENQEDPLLYIADLHRVRRRKPIKPAWRIKDLAALNYSAPQHIISRTDRLRFLQAYGARFPQDQAFMEAILKKTGQIKQHDKKNRENARPCAHNV